MTPTNDPTGRRWNVRPDDSNWGDFGLDDQIGRLNLVTPAKVLTAMKEVVQGLTFCLSLPLDCPYRPLSVRRGPPRLRPTYRGPGKPNMNYAVRDDNPLATDLISDDQALLTLQYSTHWDSLAHVGQSFDVAGDGTMVDVYYNGYRAVADVLGAGSDEDWQIAGRTGAKRLGIENMAVRCVQGRGVLIDLERHFGTSGQVVTYKQLAQAMADDGISVEEGDFVCLKTGFASQLLALGPEDDPASLFAKASALDGRDPDLLKWITDTGLVALIADNYAVEALPASSVTARRHATLPLHEHCLFKLGVHLGELWFFNALAAWLHEHGRSSFLLTAPPLRLPGAVGSPVTPVATV